LTHLYIRNGVISLSVYFIQGNFVMKTQTLKVLIASATIAALGLGATTANAATATATARAKILRQVTITNTTALQFGTIVTGTAASTVVVSSTGARTCGTGLVCSGASSAAGFNVTGTSGQVVAVSVPARVTLSTTGGDSMTASLAASASSLTLASNAASFSVGGTLSVGANQADGDYEGTFIATADYQ
jgi:Mat/Ecp fimbriae major subunit